MSPVPTQHEIARHGELIWGADAPDAGPYRIGSRWFVFASFGERTPGAAIPGDDRQLEAFYTSRAVFHALRDLTDGSLLELSDRAVGTAAHAARDVGRSWRAKWAKIDTDAYEAAVRAKVTLVVEAARRLT